VLPLLLSPNPEFDNRFSPHADPTRRSAMAPRARQRVTAMRYV